MRQVERRYVDPLEAIWVAALGRVGLRLARSSEVFASTEAGVLQLGTQDTLDADDCLAQMIFHELCHSVVAGETRFHEPDWGMSNYDDGDEAVEHATLRLQAHLAGRHGLRSVFGPTTDFRAYYDALPADPLAGEDATAVLAREALTRVDRAPWGPHLSVALEATERVLEVVCAAGAAEAVPEGELPSLLATFSRASDRADP